MRDWACRLLRMAGVLHEHIACFPSVPAISSGRKALRSADVHQYNEGKAPDRMERTVLVLAEHDTTLEATAQLFQQDGFAVQVASGEDDVASWITSIKPAMMAYRLTDPATRRTVCRSALQAAAALPGARTPVLAICELNEATAAASLCKEGLADDYLILPHLKTDVDRVVTVTERLIALRQQREIEHRRAEAISQLWRDFMRFDFDLEQEILRSDGRPESKAAESLAAARTAHHRAKSRLSGAPVLVVEDDPDFQALLKAIVTTLRQPVIGASTATEALQWLEKNEPSLMLLDYQLPGQDGVNFLEWIRKSPRLQPVPVVMLTGHSRPDTVQRVKKLGVSDFIVKPSDPGTLMKKIAAYL